LDKIPFSVYDFFAYLSSGAILVITADYVWSLGILEQQNLATVFGLMLVIIAYIAGQAAAQFSSFLLEQLFVAKLLGRPALVLLGGKARFALLPLLFPNYYRPFRADTQKRIAHQAATHGCQAQGETLFEHAYPLVTAVERYQTRLDAFRNQYGFARNTSFALLLSAFAICCAHFVGTPDLSLRWAALAALGGITMLYRYLKFFRQYSYELFLRYSQL
jgi:hypothetical protein